jgi:Negative regulator of beta-lactamase expression
MSKDYIEVPIPYFWLRGDDEQVSNIEIKSDDRNLKDLMNFLMKNPEELGTHFVVSQDGDILQCVEPENKIKFYPGLPAPEMVGIIVAGEGNEKQILALQTLCVELCTTYTIALNRIETSIENFPVFEFLNSLGAGIIDALIHSEAET